MSAAEFLNCWKILRSIDRYELVGSAAEMDDADWARFRGDPVVHLVIQPKRVQDAIWAIVEKRS